MDSENIALGTYRIKGNDCINIINEGIKIGYKHIDTAELYKNHKEVGEGIIKSGVNRNNLFITSKISNKNIKKSNIIESIYNIKKELNTDYLDLILLHNPSTNYINAWENLAKNYSGLDVRYIGTSNFTIKNLDEIYNKTGIIPYLNQIELSLWNQPTEELIKYHNNYNIKIEAHSIFTNNNQIKNLNYILYCNENNINPYELAIKYLLKQNISIVTGTNNYENLHKNLIWSKCTTDYNIDFNKVKKLNIKYTIYNKFM